MTIPSCIGLPFRVLQNRAVSSSLDCQILSLGQHEALQGRWWGKLILITQGFLTVLTFCGRKNPARNSCRYLYLCTRFPSYKMGADFFSRVVRSGARKGTASIVLPYARHLSAISSSFFKLLLSADPCSLQHWTRLTN
jgi:hypothetical protein